MRRLLKWFITFGLLYAALVAGLLAAMYQPPVVFGRIMSRLSKLPDIAYAILPFEGLWLVARRGHLNVGDPAPDFSLQTPDRQTRVQLSSFRGHNPVVLVFGSHT